MIKINHPYKIKKVKRGQGSTELMITLAVVLLIFLVMMGINSNFFDSSTSTLKTSKAQTSVTKLANAVNMVTAQGRDSRVQVHFELPDGLESLNVSANTISAKFSNRDDVYYANTAVNVSGTLPIDPGRYTATVESTSGGAIIFLTDREVPNSVTSLISPGKGITWIQWNWVAPTNDDFSSSIVFLDGVQKVTTTNTYYNATGLASETNYTLTVHTQDTSGNINNTDVNSTVVTDSPVGLTSDNKLVFTNVCVAEDNTDKGTFDGSCDGQYPETCGDGDDLLSCSDAFQETHTALRSGNNYYYGGIKTDLYNTTITNCFNITQVMLCYDWWRNANLQDCDISVDANGGSSFTAVTTSCPGTSSAGVTCTDVTSLETWTCTNFFGVSGTRAQIKSEAQKQGGKGSATISWDVLYFNVTYLKE